MTTHAEHVATSGDEQDIRQRCDAHIPGQLRAASALYHIETADEKNASVLYLGCGDGTDIVSWAQSHPQATLIGIDIDAAAIAAGTLSLTQNGVNNLELYCLQFDEILSVQPGIFDYIIIGGIFRYLNAETRTLLLQQCKA